MGNCGSIDESLAPVAIVNEIPPQLDDAADKLQIEKVKCDSIDKPLISKSQSFQISPQVMRITNQLLTKFSICKEVNNILQQLAFTTNQATSLASTIIETVQKLQLEEPSIQLNIINNFFNEENIQNIQDDKLYYQGIIEKIKLKNNNQISEFGYSRIYHTVANIKKYKEIKIKEYNQFGIMIQKNNQYKFLSKEQLEDVIKYQVIGKIIIKIGQKIYFRFLEINAESSNMCKLILEFFIKKQNIKLIKNLKYDLSEDEVMNVAKISRQVCQYIQNGVYLLFVYFVRSSSKLQKQLKMSSQKIEEKLSKALKMITNEYPPGQKGLKKQQQYLLDVLRNLGDIPRNKSKNQSTGQLGKQNYDKVIFKYNLYELNSNNKQQQVDNIIMNEAIIAQQNKQLFQQLVKATCVQRCVYFKIGLKYYPNNPNKKALTRIKQKLFLKDIIIDKNLTGNIQQILKRQQNEYLKKVDKQLQKLNNFQFFITDMIRGKCIFIKIQDIIDTVNQIKRYVKQNNKYGLVKIQSRFNNDVPISDVTMKIALNNKIVAQLQLTIQTNAATYNFAHKIYQLQRTKVFTKLKITNNYYLQSQHDFKQLITRSVNLLHKNKSIQQTDCQQIKNAFQLQQIMPKPFSKIIEYLLQQKYIKQAILKLVNSIKADLQDLMLPLLNISMRKWDKDVGILINRALNNQHSPKLKAVLLSFFFDKIDISIQSQRMQQFVLTDLQKQVKKKYFEEYLRQYFSIQNPFNFQLQTHRIFTRGQQLQQISFDKRSESAPIQLQKSIFFQSIINDEVSLNKAQKLKEFIRFYFGTRKQDGKIYNQFQNYYKWLFKIFQKNQKIDKNGLMISQVNILKATQLLENRQNFKEANKLLNQAKSNFKKNEKYERALNCDLLLVECYLEGQDNLKKIIGQYITRVKEQAKTLGLQIKGRQIAKCLWRITKNIWGKSQNKKQILQTIAKDAFLQLSRSTGKDLIYAMIQIWQQFQRYGVSQVDLYENNTLKYEKINLKGVQKYKYLNLVKWKQLASINLSYNNMGSAECEYLIRSDWKQLTTLNLQNNSIESSGCKILSQGNWKNLTILNLQNNSIEDEGCEYLATADWKKLTTLFLSSNSIGDQGCENLTKADWKKLTTLSLQSNSIEAAGCEYLTKANWKHLTTINLQSNNIEAIGCKNLTIADWKQLTTLNLSWNNIGDAGCEFLVLGDWKNLTTLDLQSNSIGDMGCENLSKADWRQLTSLNLSWNAIGAVGCQNLGKGDRKQLTVLDLSSNKIGGEGVENLSKANWKLLASLSLSKNNIEPSFRQNLRSLFKKQIYIRW